MVYLVHNKRAFQPIQFLIFLSVIVVVVVTLIYSWQRWGVPFANGTFLTPSTKSCTVAPTRPINLFSEVVDNRVYLKWTATTFTDNYTVSVGTRSGFTRTQTIRELITPDNETAVINLNPGNYYVRVQSNNTCGTSGNSTENAFAITTFPEKFRICKKNNPGLCLRYDPFAANGDVPTIETVDQSIATEAYLRTFEFRYDTLTQRIINTGSSFDYCLNDNPTPPLSVENLVNFGVCPADGTAWTITFDDGRILSNNNYVLGAGSGNGSQAYNTDVTVLTNPNDSRYVWEIVALTF